jgi:hypothetical protein
MHVCLVERIFVHMCLDVGLYICACCAGVQYTHSHVHMLGIAYIFEYVFVMCGGNVCTYNKKLAN